jgi:hypothetical protein
MRALVLVSVSALFACGGSAGEAPHERSAPSAATAPADDTGAGTGAGTEQRARAAEEGPEWTFTAAQVPDPCQILTREDATEIFGAPAKSGVSPPAGDYPCQYWSEDGASQLVLNMSIWQDWKEHLGVEQLIEYCGGEQVAALESPGRRAVLFESGNEACTVDYFWVSTGVYYQGTEDSPQFERMGEDGRVVAGPLAGYIHFTFSLHPTPERDVLVEKLSTAAERAMARLPR